MAHGAGAGQISEDGAARFGGIAGAVETEIGVLRDRVRTLDKQSRSRGLHRNVHRGAGDAIRAHHHRRRSRLGLPRNLEVNLALELA